jgi:centromere DNA-binding complex CBF3 subunit-like protein/transcriptional activator of glycolytic enzymes GCR1
MAAFYAPSKTAATAPATAPATGLAPALIIDVDTDVQSSIIVAESEDTSSSSSSSPPPSPSSRIERAAINNAELRTNSYKVRDIICAGRPKGTTLAYEPKQKEYRRFCDRKQYQDGDAVTEDKLLLFLIEDVVGRPLRMKSRRAADEIPLHKTRLSWRSVRGYVTAITDLYQQQKALGVNSHPSPRVNSVRAYIRTLQRQDTQQDKLNYADKGRDTLLDGYTEADLERIAGELWGHATEAPECHLRTLADILLGHYMLTRGGDRRAIEISDLFTFEFSDEGPTRCMPLILTTRAGKQNQHGRLETAGALRNRKPLICILGAIAFYLLYRWDLTTEPFPDFESRPKWYDIRLIKGTRGTRTDLTAPLLTDPTAPLSYNSQRDWIVKAFSYAGIRSTQKTHVGRSSGAKTAELKGVSEMQIQRAGRWNPDQMIGCYLNSLPRKFMRRMAGHPDKMGCFDIPRARVSPPESLLSMIWPQLDRWKGRFGPGPEQLNDLAAAGLINLLLYLREVILQDSVFLIDRFPTCPVWNHRVFQHADYLPYARRLSASVCEEERQPAQYTLLSQAVPELTEYMQEAKSQTDARLAGILTEIADLKDARLAGILTAIANLTTELQLQKSTSETKVTPGHGLAPAPAPTPAPASASASTATADLTAPVPPEAQAPTPAAIPEAPTPAYPLGLDPPKHRMSRAVKDVQSLWREWTVGLLGQPSIAALDSRWSSRWRAGRRAELQWYSLRKEVIDEIHRIAGSRHVSMESAMYTVDMEQRKSGLSMDLFCKELRKAKKLRAAAGAD